MSMVRFLLCVFYLWPCPRLHWTTLSLLNKMTINLSAQSKTSTDLSFTHLSFNTCWSWSKARRGHLIDIYLEVISLQLCPASTQDVNRGKMAFEDFSLLMPIMGYLLLSFDDAHTAQQFPLHFATFLLKWLQTPQTVSVRNVSKTSSASQWHCNSGHLLHTIYLDCELFISSHLKQESGCKYMLARTLTYFCSALDWWPSLPSSITLSLVWNCLSRVLALLEKVRTPPFCPESWKKARWQVKTHKNLISLAQLSDPVGPLQRWSRAALWLVCQIVSKIHWAKKLGGAVEKRNEDTCCKNI